MRCPSRLLRCAILLPATSNRSGDSSLLFRCPQGALNRRQSDGKMSTTVGKDLIDVVIIDDHRMVAESIGAVLQAQPDINVVGIAGTVSEGILLVANLEPRVVVMDLQLPDGDGGEATKRILEKWPNIAVIMLTGTGATDALARAIEAGCAGFLIKGLQVRALDEAVRSVSRGEVVIHAGMLQAALPSLRRVAAVSYDLTAREVQILSLLAKGSSTEQLASELFVARNTVRNHIANILTKLGAHSRLEAVAVAMREGLISTTS